MSERICECGCGRSLEGKRADATYYEDSCRLAAWKERRKGQTPKTPEERIGTATAAPAEASTHVPGGSYTDHEIERGLVAIALCSGNTRRAHRELKQRGLDIPRSTLLVWIDNYADRYARVRAEILPRLKDEVAEQHTDLARYQMDVTRETSPSALSKKRTSFRLVIFRLRSVTSTWARESIPSEPGAARRSNGHR